MLKTHDTNSPTASVLCADECVCRVKSPADVSGFLPGMSRQEMDRHIEDCRYLAQLARARFRGSHAAKDSSEAQRWQDAMDAAIKARRELVAAEVEEARITNGLDYFQSLAAIELSKAYRFDVPARAVRRRTLG